MDKMIDNLCNARENVEAAPRPLPGVGSVVLIFEIEDRGEFGRSATGSRPFRSKPRNG